MNESIFKLNNSSNIEYQNQLSIPSSSIIEAHKSNTLVRKKCCNDFKFIGLIGEGSFSMVALAVDVSTKKQYAIKICDKKQIKKENKQKAIMKEKEIMSALDSNYNPFFIRLYFTFQDDFRLYFGLSYAVAGELHRFIRQLNHFDYDCTLFYSAQILLALEHLHKLGIIHRDLKPENILLNEKLHIQISDFGSAFRGNFESIKPISSKIIEKLENNEENYRRRNSFVGTAQYVSPEMLKYKHSSTASDLWAFGVIIFQMMFGDTPFKEMTEFLIFQKILSLNYSFPKAFNQEAKKLIQSLLVLDPLERLGANDKFEQTNNQYISIRSHQFFINVQNWNEFYSKPSPLANLINCEGLRKDLKLHPNLDNIEPGLCENQLSRLLGLDLCNDSINLKISSPQNWSNQNKVQCSSLKSDQPMPSNNLDETIQSKMQSKCVKKKNIFSKLFK